MKARVFRFVGAIALAASLSTLAAYRLAQAEEPAPAVTNAPAAGADSKKVTPLERVNSTPIGELKNPFQVTPENVAAGKEFFFSYSCNGCHGGTGGGGMCPPLTGDVWFYGLSDDALFRLVTLGSVGMRNAGIKRLGGKGLEMPAFGEIIQSDEQLWKILTWVRSVYKGDPKKKFW